MNVVCTKLWLIFLFFFWFPPIKVNAQSNIINKKKTIIVSNVDCVIVSKVRYVDIVGMESYIKLQKDSSGLFSRIGTHGNDSIIYLGSIKLTNLEVRNLLPKLKRSKYKNFYKVMPFHNVEIDFYFKSRIIQTIRFSTYNRRMYVIQLIDSSKWINKPIIKENIDYSLIRSCFDSVGKHNFKKYIIKLLKREDLWQLE